MPDNLAREVERWQEEVVEDVVEEVVEDDAGVVAGGVGLGEGARKSAFFVWKRQRKLITRKRTRCGSF